MNLGLFSCLFMMKRNDQYFETIDDFLVRNRIENLKQIDLKK